jgi:hypothetical protein
VLPVLTIGVHAEKKTPVWMLSVRLVRTGNARRFYLLGYQNGTLPEPRKRGYEPGLRYCYFLWCRSACYTPFLPRNVSAVQRLRVNLLQILRTEY